MSEEITVTVQIGDNVLIKKGDNKGEKAKVIAVYTNSVAVQLDKTEKDGKPRRTVVNHKKYDVIS
ncbi:DUF2187 family protein [Anaerobacillus sp. MEB173]|uniref:DUF2187 family protein n=1 Tax=Anaerobacillus sp. MEB173 TaxID=3383345 RepID=UPI003F8E579A